MREIDAQLAAHYLVVVEIADGGCGGLRVAVFGEAEAFGTTGFTIVDETEGENPAGAAEDLGDLLFSKTW